MTAHVRQQIQEQFVRNCANLTTTSTRVFKSRVYDMDQTEVPALCIYANSEASARATMQTTASLERTLDVIVEGYVQENLASEMDDTMDTIAAEVEVAIASDPTCNGLAKDTVLTSTELTMTGEGDLPGGMVRMTWTVLYFTKTTAPTVAL